MKSFIAAAGLVAVAQAFTPPVSPPTYGSLLTPDVNTPVTTGQEFTITWSPKQPAEGVTVSLVLCNGPSTNCVLQSSAIVEGVSAAAGSYKWNVPCSLPEGVQATETGYGMLIIVDGTGEFQYSTQFSVKKGDSCSASGPTTTTTSSATASLSSDTSAGWYSWTSSGFNTTTVPAYTATSKYTSAPAVVTSASKPAESSYVYSTPASSAPSVSNTPQQFTGAAAMPTGFVNAAGVIGAAALAALAL